jgi:hypothetical protein
VAGLLLHFQVCFAAEKKIISLFKQRFMKKLLMMMMGLAMVVMVNAQAQPEQKKDMKKDYITMKDGKVMQSKDGNVAELTEDVTLDNGSVVSKDGTVKMKDGKTVTLKEGDYVWMDGKITHGKKKDGER